METSDAEENGLLKKEDFLKLQKFINENDFILSKVIEINSEQVLNHFTLAVYQLDEEEGEVVLDRNLTFLFYTLRNSIILNIPDDIKDSLVPLSNLALSVDMCQGLITLLDTNKQLQFCLDQEDLKNFEEFCGSVAKAEALGKIFFLDTLKVENMVLIYHKIRNVVIKVLVEKLQHFLNTIQPVLDDKEESDHVTTIRTILGLGWNQQVIAFEALKYEVKFPAGFQVYLIMTLTQQFSKSALSPQSDTSMENKVPKLIIKNIRQHSKQSIPSYHKSTKIHCCNFCGYSSKKLSNIKNHLKGRHRLTVIPTGETGFTTKNENGDVVNFIPRMRKNAQYERVLKCNYCHFTSQAGTLSHMKKHIAKSHKYVLPDEEGFTAVYQPLETKAEEEAPEDPLQLSSDNLGDDNIKEDASEEEEEGPTVEDFLECSIDVQEEEDVQIKSEDVHMKSMPEPKPVPDTVSHARGRRRAEKVKVQSCNDCDYLTRKMSNIKTHVKNVHKFVERPAGDRGFTTLFMNNPKL